MTFDPQRLETMRQQAEQARSDADALQQAYEREVAAMRASLPRLTPELIAAFWKLKTAEDPYGELDSEHHPTAWAVMAELARILAPDWWVARKDEDES